MASQKDLEMTVKLKAGQIKIYIVHVYTVSASAKTEN